MKPTIQTEYYKCRPVRILNKGWGLFLFCLFFIFCGVMVWQLFPTPRLHRAEIVVHDEQTFKKLQQKHGAQNTRVVIYEADGEACFYNQNDEKVILK